MPKKKLPGLEITPCPTGDEGPSPIKSPIERVKRYNDMDMLSARGETKEIITKLEMLKTMWSTNPRGLPPTTPAPTRRPSVQRQPFSTLAPLSNIPKPRSPPPPIIPEPHSHDLLPSISGKMHMSPSLRSNFVEGHLRTFQQTLADVEDVYRKAKSGGTTYVDPILTSGQLGVIQATHGASIGDHIAGVVEEAQQIHHNVVHAPVREAPVKSRPPSSDSDSDDSVPSNKKGNRYMQRKIDKYQKRLLEDPMELAALEATVAGHLRSSTNLNKTNKGSRRHSLSADHALSTPRGRHLLPPPPPVLFHSTTAIENGGGHHHVKNRVFGLSRSPSPVPNFPPPLVLSEPKTHKVKNGAVLREEKQKSVWERRQELVQEEQNKMQEMAQREAEKHQRAARARLVPLQVQKKHHDAEHRAAQWIGVICHLKVSTWAETFLAKRHAQLTITAKRQEAARKILHWFKRRFPPIKKRRIENALSVLTRHVFLIRNFVIRRRKERAATVAQHFLIAIKQSSHFVLHVRKFMAKVLKLQRWVRSVVALRRTQIQLMLLQWLEMEQFLAQGHTDPIDFPIWRKRKGKKSIHRTLSPEPSPEFLVVPLSREQRFSVTPPRSRPGTSLTLGIPTKPRLTSQPSSALHSPEHSFRSLGSGLTVNEQLEELTRTLSEVTTVGMDIRMKILRRLVAQRRRLLIRERDKYNLELMLFEAHKKKVDAVLEARNILLAKQGIRTEFSAVQPPKKPFLSIIIPPIQLKDLVMEGLDETRKIFVEKLEDVQWHVKESDRFRVLHDFYDEWKSKEEFVSSAFQKGIL